MNVSFDPQEIVVSALAPILGADIQDPVGREIVYGMDYETGSWTQSGNVTSKKIFFSRQHEKPPVLFLVYASPGAINANTAFGELFVNYVRLFGVALQTTSTQAKFGMRMSWTTGSSTSQVSQSVTNITTADGLSGYATNEDLTFSSFASTTYIRSGRKYSWIAVFMPE